MSRGEQQKAVIKEDRIGFDRIFRDKTPEKKPDEINVIVDDIPLLKDGDKFTVAGMKLRKDGTTTSRCKKGNETVFVARTADD